MHAASRPTPIWRSAAGFFRRAWAEAVAFLRAQPLIPRCMFASAALSFVAGAIYGLLAGLEYLPTLWVAILEGGILAAVAGTLVGILVGVVAFLARALARGAGRVVR